MKTKGCVFSGRRYWSPPGAAAPPLSLPDVSRYGNDGVFTNVTWVQTPSGLWYCDAAGAAGDGIVLGTDLSMALLRWTLKAWFNPDTVADLGKLIVRADANITTNYYLQHTPGGGLVQGFYDAAFRNIAGGKIYVGLWSMVAVTFDGTYLRTFVNGVLEATSADLSAFTPPTGAVNTYLCRNFNALTPYNGGMTLPLFANYPFSQDKVNEHFEAERRLVGA